MIFKIYQGAGKRPGSEKKKKKSPIAKKDLASAYYLII